MLRLYWKWQCIQCSHEIEFRRPSPIEFAAEERLGLDDQLRPGRERHTFRERIL